MAPRRASVRATLRTGERGDEAFLLLGDKEVHRLVRGSRALLLPRLLLLLFLLLLSSFR